MSQFKLFVDLFTKEVTKKKQSTSALFVHTNKKNDYEGKMRKEIEKQRKKKKTTIFSDSTKKALTVSIFFEM